MNFPLVSCLMPTRGKAATQPHVINEAIHSFVNQDYPNKELVILNDNPGHKLWTSVPNVRVINWDTFFQSLGAKRNTLIELAAGEILLQWDDDDYSLPNRCKQAVEHLQGFDYWNPRMWFYIYIGQPPKPDGNGVGLMCAAYKRNVFRNAYPNVTKCEDSITANWAEVNLKVNRKVITDPKEITYCYMFNRSSWHLSGHVDMDAAFAATPLGPKGTYKLKAETQTDWVSVCRKATQQ